MILVLETALGCTTQEAAEATNDLISSRMQQFEHTVFTELPILFDQHGLRPDERMAALVYAADCRTGSRVGTSGTCAPAGT